MKQPSKDELVRVAQVPESEFKSSQDDSAAMLSNTALVLLSLRVISCRLKCELKSLDCSPCLLFQLSAKRLPICIWMFLRASL